jgi:hypothetical protein
LIAVSIAAPVAASVSISIAVVSMPGSMTGTPPPAMARTMGAVDKVGNANENPRHNSDCEYRTYCKSQYLKGFVVYYRRPDSRGKDNGGGQGYHGNVTGFPEKDLWNRN